MLSISHLEISTQSEKALSQLNKKNRFRRLLTELNRTKYLQLLVLPGLIYFIIFKYIPMYGVIIAFKDFNMRLGILKSPWVGFENFIKFFNYPQFNRLIINTLVLSIYHLIFAFPASIIFALMLNEVKNQTYKRFVQTVSYLPHFISTVSIAGMLVLFLSPQGGFINNILSYFHIEPIYFLAETRWFRTIYTVSDIWQGTGWGAIIYLAALSNVDQEMYEAATIDGATRLQKIWYISIPAIQPTIVIMLIMSLGKMMSLSSEKVLLLQMPATYEVSDVIGTYIYRRGLIYAEYSFSAAVGLFNSAVNLVLVLISNFICRKVTETSLW